MNCSHPWIGKVFRIAVAIWVNIRKLQKQESARYVLDLFDLVQLFVDWLNVLVTASSFNSSSSSYPRRLESFTASQYSWPCLNTADSMAASRRDEPKKAKGGYAMYVLAIVNSGLQKHVSVRFRRRYAECFISQSRWNLFQRGNSMWAKTRGNWCKRIRFCQNSIYCLLKIFELDLCERLATWAKTSTTAWTNTCNEE